MSGSLRADSLNTDTSEVGSSEGLGAKVPAQIGMALAGKSAGEFPNCSPKDYVMAMLASDTEESFVGTLAERRIFLF